MKATPPPFSRRNPQHWYDAWHTGTSEALYVIVAYHQLACAQVKDHVRDPLPMLFTDDQILAANARRHQALRLYKTLLATPGAHTADLVVAADHTWLYIHRLYERIPTTHRIPPPKTR